MTGFYWTNIIEWFNLLSLYLYLLPLYNCFKWILINRSHCLSRYSYPQLRNTVLCLVSSLLLSDHCLSSYHDCVWIIYSSCSPNCRINNKLIRLPNSIMRQDMQQKWIGLLCQPQSQSQSQSQSFSSGLWILDFGLGLDNNINTFMEKLPVPKIHILKSIFYLNLMANQLINK